MTDSKAASDLDIPTTVEKRIIRKVATHKKPLATVFARQRGSTRQMGYRARRYKRAR